MIAQIQSQLRELIHHLRSFKSLHSLILRGRLYVFTLLLLQAKVIVCLSPRTATEGCKDVHQNTTIQIHGLSRCYSLGPRSSWSLDKETHTVTWFSGTTTPLPRSCSHASRNLAAVHCACPSCPHLDSLANAWRCWVWASL